MCFNYVEEEKGCFFWKIIKVHLVENRKNVKYNYL